MHQHTATHKLYLGATYIASHTPIHCNTQAVSRDYLYTIHQHTAPHKLYLGTIFTVSHALTHCTTHAVPRDHLHIEPYTLHYTSCT
ncbi:predicted protein [Nematostella vectensis]|uniref:Uncharacterized protein n=1 Tax=Nematostella vectensis TaxID=45351 RepID=A8DVX5_NEMVE|nr:predicted protein [Nematostella vectensis]|eukprot:XP_001617734.1 hypothetical protein NEMVEDRAFT_v1g156863 [Nematostella vectensis]